VLKIAVNDRII